jgi:hypothetical protein
MAKRRTINRLIPLDEAAWHFASPKAKDELQRAQSQPLSNVRTEEPKDRIDAFKKLQDMLGALIDYAVDRNEPIWKMQRHLIRRLHDGRLEAFGVRTKPEIGREPEKIPEFIFDRPKVRWGARTIENFGQKYEGVGVRQHAAIAVAVQSPVKTEPPSTGRPSKAAEIEKVINLLIRRGVRLQDMPRAAAYDEIKKCAKKELKANIELGYSDPVILRCLVRTLGKRT